MWRIQRLPFIMGCAAAIISGAACYAAGLRNQDLYLRMAVMMLIFFALGLYVRSTVLSINKELQQKKSEQAKKEEQKVNLQKERQAGIAYKAESGQSAQQNDTTRKIDTTVGGDEEEIFEPLILSKAIKTKVKE